MRERKRFAWIPKHGHEAPASCGYRRAEPATSRVSSCSCMPRGSVRRRGGKAPPTFGATVAALDGSGEGATVPARGGVSPRRAHDFAKQSIMCYTFLTVRIGKRYARWEK